MHNLVSVSSIGAMGTNQSNQLGQPSFICCSIAGLLRIGDADHISDTSTRFGSKVPSQAMSSNSDKSTCFGSKVLSQALFSYSIFHGNVDDQIPIAAGSAEEQTASAHSEFKSLHAARDLPLHNSLLNSEFKSLHAARDLPLHRSLLKFCPASTWFLLVEQFNSRKTLCRYMPILAERGGHLDRQLFFSASRVFIENNSAIPCDVSRTIEMDSCRLLNYSAEFNSCFKVSQSTSLCKGDTKVFVPQRNKFHVSIRCSNQLQIKPEGANTLSASSLASNLFISCLNVAAVSEGDALLSRNRNLSKHKPYLRETDRLLCYIPNMKFERSNQSNHHYVINGSCAARNELTTNLSIVLVSEGDALMCRANYQNQHKSNQIQVWLSTRVVYTSLIQPSQCNRNNTATLYVMAAVADNSDFIPVSEGDVLSLTACNRNLHETISIRLSARDVHSSLMPSLQMQFTLKSKIAIAAERKQSTFIGCITAVSERDVLQAPSRNIRDLQLVRLNA